MFPTSGRFDLTSKAIFYRSENFSVFSLRYFIDRFQNSSQSVERRGRHGHRRLLGSLSTLRNSYRLSSAILLGWIMFHGLVRSQVSLHYSHRVQSPESPNKRRMGPMTISISGFRCQGQALDRQRHLRLLGFITRDLFVLASPNSAGRLMGSLAIFTEWNIAKARAKRATRLTVLIFLHF